MFDMNRKLFEMYSTVLDNDVWSQLSKERNLGGPLLIHVPHAYHEASVKLMVVGQQTNGWGHPEDGIEALLDQYRRFEMGKRKMKSPFWQAAYEVYNFLNPDGPPRGFLWSNLIKVDDNGQKPHHELEELICSTCLRQYELCVTKPDVVILFTGHWYDNRIKATFPCVEFEQVKGFNLRCLACLNRLNHDKEHRKSFRTYHPGYLRRSRQWHVIEKLRTLLGR